MKTYGPFSVRDSGAPCGGGAYTTLILFHGMGWHSAVFSKLFSLVDARNVRLVAPNRLGYPGSAPFPDAEQAQLSNIAELATTNPQSAAEAHLNYIKEDTKKMLGFLLEFISQENIPVEGGIILAGWSLGAVTILGLLAYADGIPPKDVEVDFRSYVKHVVIYDAPACVMGYAPPPNVCAPLFDPSLTPGEILKIFPNWVSAYYPHGEGLTELEYKAAEYPPPTISSMDPLDLQRCLEINPVLPGAPDDQFIRLGVQLGVFSKLRESAIFLDQEHLLAGNRWGSVEVKYVWCDHSPWELPWGVHCLQNDLTDRERAGRITRKVDVVRLRGGNHFVSH